MKNTANISIRFYLSVVLLVSAANAVSADTFKMDYFDEFTEIVPEGYGEEDPVPMRYDQFIERYGLVKTTAVRELMSFSVSETYRYADVSITHDYCTDKRGTFLLFENLKRADIRLTIKDLVRYLETSIEDDWPQTPLKGDIPYDFIVTLRSGSKSGVVFISLTRKMLYYCSDTGFYSVSFP